METSGLVALSRQAAVRREMAVIANNLANMNTIGFQGEQMMFVEHLVKSEGQGSLIPTVLSFSLDIGQIRNTAEGPIQSTSNPLDIAIKGDGWFAIETEDGERYTRNGRFRINQEGQIVTQHGYPVLSDAGVPFTLAPGDTDIDIGRDGTVATNNGELGRFRVVEFQRPQRMEKEAGGIYKTNEPPEEPEKFEILQGALESSNVNPILEMTKMIDVHRSYNGARTFIDEEDKRQRKMIEQLAPRV